MINYERHPELSYTQKRQNLRNLRNTILENLARDAFDTWTAFRLLQDMVSEVLDGPLDYEYSKALIEDYPERKHEAKEAYEAIMSALAAVDVLHFGTKYYVLQTVEADLLYEELGLTHKDSDTDE